MGHPHDPSCTHCLRGRLREKGRPRKAVVDIKTRGETVYMDLMGPFEPDLKGNIYEVTALESKYGWIEVIGIEDKSSSNTLEAVKSLIRDVMNRSNQHPELVGRLHTDQGKEFQGEVKKYMIDLGIEQTNTGGYNSSTNPVEGAQGRFRVDYNRVPEPCWRKP